MQPGYTNLDQRPQAFFLRTFGHLLLMTGLALNIWLLASGEEIDLRLALLVLAPGLILLFTAFLAETTPSMRGCLSVFGLVLALMAGFWAWVGVTVVLSPEDEPPEILREVIEPEPPEEPEEPEEEEVTPETDEDEEPGESEPDSVSTETEE